MYTWKEATDKDADYFKGLGTQKRFRRLIVISGLNLRCAVFYFNGFPLNTMRRRKRSWCVRSVLSYAIGASATCV